MSDSEGPWGGRTRRPVRKPRSRWPFIAALLGCVAITLLALSAVFPGRLSSGEDWDFLLRSMAVLVIAASALLAVRRQPLTHMVRNGLVWLGIFGALLLGFAYRDVASDAWSRIRSTIVPGYAVATAAHQTIVSRDADGSFYAIADVNGVPVNFLIDTGASDIVLSPADAKRLGLDLQALKFDYTYETANGIGRGAPYLVNTLTLGDIDLSDVKVSINQAPMRASLLGMAFFKRLSGFRIEGDRLILTWL